MSELFSNKNRKEHLKTMITRLHEGEPPEKIKEEFKQVLATVTPDEIAHIEEELIKEGVSQEEIQKLCDVHLAVFQESLGEMSVPEGHPIHILMEEHKLLLQYANDARTRGKDMKSPGEPETIAQLTHIAEHFKESESHYIREENVLFPYLEKHGVTQPPAIMWMEHDRIRGIKKDFYEVLDSRESMDFADFVKKLKEVSTSLTETLSSHFYKENNILFPTALKVIEDEEWKDIRQQFDELGYCCFAPVKAEAVLLSEKLRHVTDKITFETGAFSLPVLESVLNTLPVDITFVDKTDTVQYFSQSKERIFPRTKAVLGRKVQQCHPQKSVHVVTQILEAFKKGERDAAEFWITMGDRLIYIRYFAVRQNKEYVGCLEVTQDITDIQKIKGEKRLLSWS